MNRERYKEKYEEGWELFWPSEKEDKITRKFYEDLSHISKKASSNKKEQAFLNLFCEYLEETIFKINFQF